MITEVKNNIFKTCVINFEDYDKYEDIRKIKGHDFVQILGNKKPIDGRHIRCNEQATLTTDLTLPIESIWRNFRSNYRNEIRKVGGVLVRQYTSREVTNELITDLTETYEKMFEDKGINRKMPISQLLAYIKSESLLMTVAEDENGKKIVYHTYITDSRFNAKLWQSCSLFRTENKKYRNYVGMVNKYLHWEDIKYFVAREFKLMDWGGVDFSASEHGIGDFKHGFGGDFIQYYNLIFEASFKSRIYSKYKSITK